MSSDQDSQTEEITKEVPPKKTQKQETPLQVLKEKFEHLATPEEKVELALQFMRDFLSQEHISHFKPFWEVKALCFETFKLSMNPIRRTFLWEEFSELCAQAKHLKQIWDEKASFASEQIDLAITALAKQVENKEAFIEAQPYPSFPKTAKKLIPHIHQYATIQRKLNAYRIFAARMDALKKELMQAQIRIRHKNKFFKSLSKLGKEIFPIKKELIQEISELFQKDVEHYIATHFEQRDEKTPIYKLREEMKTLQGIGKVLTLSTSVFSKTRKMLSDIWDELKELDKKVKEEVSEQKKASREGLDVFWKNLEGVRLSFEEKHPTRKELSSQSQSLEQQLGQLKLMKHDYKKAKEGIKQLTQHYQQCIKQKEQEEAEQKTKQLKKQLTNIRSIIDQLEKEEVAAVEKVETELQELKQISSLSREHYMEIEALLIDFEWKKLVLQKQHLERATLPDEELIQALYDLLQQKRALRVEMKRKLDEVRRDMGKSGLDFELAMLYREHIDRWKEKLELVDQEISRLEEQILEEE